MAGYSGTPLAQKLGIKTGDKFYLKNAPEHFGELLAPLPSGVEVLNRLSHELDIVHLFERKKSVLEKSLPIYAEKNQTQWHDLGFMAAKKLRSFQRMCRKTWSEKSHCRWDWLMSKSALSMKSGGD